MSKEGIIALFLMLNVSCMRLDDSLFNKKPLTSYQLDQYTGNTDFVLDSNYNIPDSLICQFSYESKCPNEDKSLRLFGVYIGDTGSISSDTVILYCHGNKWHMDFYWQRAKLLAHVGEKLKYGVLMFDYRGYGMSPGKSTEETLYADADGAINWLKDRGCEPERLILYGYSMGCFPVCDLTAFPRRLKPHKIILEAPYASAAAMVAEGSGYGMPASFVTNLKIDNVSKVKYCNVPLFWLHGSDDHYCKLETQGQKVFDAYYGDKFKFIVNGADHNSIQTTLGFKGYCDSLQSFIRKR